MATYVTLYNFTDQGLKNIKDTVKRVEAAKKAGAAFGVHVKEVRFSVPLLLRPLCSMAFHGHRQAVPAAVRGGV